MVLQQTELIDKVIYQVYMTNSMSPDEILPLFSPQIICVSDANLNAEEYPPLEVLSRDSLYYEHIYLLYNGFTIYMWVGT